MHGVPRGLFMLAGLRSAARRVFGAGEAAVELPAPGAWYSREEAIMGTAIRVELWSEDRAGAESAMCAVMNVMHHVDETMSPYKPESELSRMNREAANGPVRLSQEMFDLLSRSLDFSRLSDGAFDITFASAGHLYDYRQGIRPSEIDLAQACKAIGYKNLLLDRATHSVRFACPGVRIDLGGFAK
ncbi:MAG TPA: FAD:protein FMN transferase, partial [Burkholderiaceae bacterium]|nr:FAD:protein FMN transferase [Burkholderiaceae bacterium]